MEINLDLVINHPQRISKLTEYFNTELPVDPSCVIGKVYKKNTDPYNILHTHGPLVANKALYIMEMSTKKDEINVADVITGSYMHDIGVWIMPEEKRDNDEYFLHGLYGGHLLRQMKLEKYARFCETHVGGTGITLDDLKGIKLPFPIPEENMVPNTLEEKLVAISDAFHTKNSLLYEKPFDTVRKIIIGKHGYSRWEIFEGFLDYFGLKGRLI